MPDLEWVFYLASGSMLKVEGVKDNYGEMKALISVFNKDKVVVIAKALHELGAEIIATEGTARVISGSGTPVTKVSDFTGFQEMLGGKIKTLHPRIHAGIATAEIQFVIVNLMPPDLMPQNPLESMDVGGVAMLRSSIKNFENVAVIVNPSSYTELIAELREKGRITRETKLRLAKEASKYVVAYDSQVDGLLERLE